MSGCFSSNTTSQNTLNKHFHPQHMVLPPQPRMRKNETCFVPKRKRRMVDDKPPRFHPTNPTAARAGGVARMGGIVDV